MDEVGETKCHSLGYAKPPWTFTGSALYQLHLVKAETARAFIPKELKLVEAFGYTLGGFFLASYEDSPAGAFDELVVIAGIVWNPPTSCAWASRVLVSSKNACDHGRKDVGLPSQVAKFSKRITPISSRQRKNKFGGGFLNMFGFDFGPKHSMDVQVSEIDGPSVTDICNINLTTMVPGLKLDNMWKGPAIKMSLPSFSGCTVYNPKLLKYSCSIECRVRSVRPAEVLGPSLASEQGKDESLSHHNYTTDQDSTFRDVDDHRRNLSISVMLSKPILALQFSCLKMQVEAPTEISHSPKTSYRTFFRVFN